MGDFCHHFPTLLNGGPAFDGVTRRDGLDVRLEWASTQLQLLTTHFLVTLSLEPSTVGQPTLRPLRLGSGGSFKVDDMVGD